MPVMDFLLRLEAAYFAQKFYLLSCFTNNIFCLRFLEDYFFKNVVPYPSITFKSFFLNTKNTPAALWKSPTLEWTFESMESREVENRLHSYESL